MNRRLALAVGLLAALRTADGAGSELPRVWLLDGTHLAAARQAVRQNPAEFPEALQAIRTAADQVLNQGPWSVMDKQHVPPSGDKHDYYSLGPYWWPNPAKPDGLPYIRRDGEVNPQRHEDDSAALKNTVAAVEALAVAWYFTGEAQYAQRAALLLRTWFLAPATRMNPHLEYGQAIPGITQGRGIGIIDTAQLAPLLDAVGLLESSAAWTEGDQQQLQAWFATYLQWLQTSSHGRDEARTENNHAVWYDVQVAAFALFTGDDAAARSVLRQVGPRRIASQIEPDGRMPLELARTRSFSYTQMNLRGFLNLARLGEHVGMDLWSYHSEDGRSIAAALNWLEPFVSGRAAWKYRQIQPVDMSSAALLYRQAARRLDNPIYRELGELPVEPRNELLWPRP